MQHGEARLATLSGSGGRFAGVAVEVAGIATSLADPFGCVTAEELAEGGEAAADDDEV